MSNLAEALEFHDRMRREHRTHIIQDDSPIIAAARRQLALEADQCGTCGGSELICIGEPHDHDDGCRCPCGRGWVYKPELMEAVGKAIYEGDNASVTIYQDGVPRKADEWGTVEPGVRDIYHKMAVPVLDALRALTEPK